MKIFNPNYRIASNFLPRFDPEESGGSDVLKSWFIMALFAAGQRWK